MDHGVELGRWVRQRRENLGMSQAEVAERMSIDMEVDQNWVTQLENGRRKGMLDFEVIAAIAAALRVSVTDVLRGAGYYPTDAEQPPEIAPGSHAIHALVDLIDWTRNPANRSNVEGLLRSIREDQRPSSG